MKLHTAFFITFVQLIIAFAPKCQAFWDEGTSTIPYADPIKPPRVSFFRWEQIPFHIPLQTWFFYWWESLHPDYITIQGRDLSRHVAAFSYGTLPLSTGVLINNRVILTAANFLEPYVDKMREIRIWVLGRSGDPGLPWRYRVWRWRRVFPRSLNPEHQHGPRGKHTPRHDLAIVHSWDRMYVVSQWSYTIPYIGYMYPEKAKIAVMTDKLKETANHELIQIGLKVGDPTVTHTVLNISNVVNCERYLPKWWGKFICIRNIPYSENAVMNGDSLFNYNAKKLFGIGCFEIRYNDDRILVFTDVRYYHKKLRLVANISNGDYYEYAYPHWGVDSGWLHLYDSFSNQPQIPYFEQKKYIEIFGYETPIAVNYLTDELFKYKDKFND